MSKRVYILFGLLVALAVLSYAVAQQRGQVYQGMSLQAWLEQATAAGSMASADQNDVEAVRHFGTNALPTLLKMAQVHDSPLKKAWIKLVRAQRLIPIRLHSDKEYHIMACFGFYSLGEIGKDGVPALINLLQNSDPSIQGAARDCLGNIGSAAKVAVPALLPFLNDSNRIVRYSAMVSLGRIHSESDTVVPILIKNLSPTNALLHATISVLSEFGEKAAPAVPALLQYLNHTNEFVRDAATNALEKIAPEAVAKAGIK